MYGAIQGGQDALYPIWLINSPEDHGFDLTSSDLGWLYTGVSPMQIFSTPLLYPQLTRLMTNKQVSYVTGYIYSFLLLITPLAALANRSGVVVQWLAMLFSYGFAQCFRFFFVTYPLATLGPPSPPPTEWCSSPTARTRTSGRRSTDSGRSCPLLVVLS